MPPNQGAFNIAYENMTRKNRINRMLAKPKIVRQNATRNLIKNKSKLTRQKGSKNLFHNYGLKRFRFNKNAAVNNKNTRGKAPRKQWAENIQNLMPEVRAKSNTIISNITQKKFNRMDPEQQNLVESIYRFSGPMSSNYIPAFQRGEYGPREAKMMANLTAQYNEPEDMFMAVNKLNLDNRTKQQFMYNIAAMYR